MNKPKKQKYARLYAGRKTSFWDKLTGRKHHRLSASVTGESDWEVETPQIRMSRAFAILLVLHVIAVGGLFAYRIWGRDEEGADSSPDAALTTAAEEVAAAPAPIPAPVTPPPAPAPAEPVAEKTYTVRAGDSIQLIAARFGVSTAALREANPEKSLVPGTELVLPRAGRVFEAPATAGPVEGPSAIFDPQAALTSAPAPRAQAVPENPEHSEIPDVIPSPADEAAVIAQPVTARPPAEQPATPVSKPDKHTVSLNPPPSSTAIAAATKAPAVTKEQVKKQPARNVGQRVYVVAKGDTVYNLARKFGFSAEEIAKANSLGTDYRITLGQQLKMPVKR